MQRATNCDPEMSATDRIHAATKENQILNDYWKSKDVLKPGVGEDQIRRAEELLGNWSVGSYIEKRTLGEDYRAGSLRALDHRSTDGYDVLLSRNPVAGEKRHVVLSRDLLPAMPKCEITVRRLGQLHSIIGIFKPSHAGYRSEDRQGDTRLMVSFFYPERDPLNIVHSGYPDIQ